MNHVEQWMEEDGITFANPRVAPPVYIRFGKWGRRPRSINHATGEVEKGLSVYPAQLTPDGVVIADDGLDFTAQECAKQLAGRMAFVVTGKEVARGSDNEPVLVGVKLLRYPIALSTIPAEVKAA